MSGEFWKTLPAHAPLIDPAAWWGGLGVVGLALLIGLMVMPRRGKLRAGAAWLVRVSAGLALLGPLVLIAGQGQDWLFKIPWSPLAAAGWLALAVGFFHGIRRTIGRQSPSLNEAATDGRLELPGWGVLVFLLLMLLAPAFSPSSNYDALEYHVGVIPHIFQAGQVTPIPHIFYSAQPTATEMLYTLSAVIEGQAWGQGPGVVQWALIVLTALWMARVLALAGVARPWRPWLTLLLLTHFIVARLCLDRMTDLSGVFFLAAGLGVALEPGLRPRSRVLLAGLMAGGALGCKWTHAGTVVLPLGLAVLAMRSLAPGCGGRWHLKTRLADGLIYGVVVFLVWLPWGVWLWHGRGNPFAPFMAGIFPSAVWPPERLAFLIQTHGPLSPWMADYWTNLIERLGWRLPGLPLVALGLVAGLGTLALDGAARRARGGRLLSRRGRALAVALTFGMAASVLLWGQLRHGADRFLAPVLLSATLMLALALKTQAVRFGAGSVRWIAIALALLSLPGVVAEYRLASFFLPPALGHESTYQTWKALMGDTADLFVAADALPAGASLLAVNEARRYPFRGRITQSSVFDHSPMRNAVRGASDAGTIRRRLAEAGFTHLLYNGFEQNRILAMHTPPSLIGDRALAAVLAQPNPALRELTLSRDYWGYTEFATEPLTPAERRAYGEFLDAMQARATWILGMGPARRPGMWIAPVEPGF